MLFARALARSFAGYAHMSLLRNPARPLLLCLGASSALVILSLAACGPKPEAVCDHIDALVEASMKVKPTPSQAAEARSNCLERMNETDASCRACAMRAKSRAEVVACRCL
jgi:hypothetical protein